MTLTISRMECRTREEVAVPLAEVLRERMAAVAKYLRIHGHEVWIVFK